MIVLRPAMAGRRLAGLSDEGTQRKSRVYSRSQNGRYDYATAVLSESRESYSPSEIAIEWMRVSQ